MKKKFSLGKMLRAYNVMPVSGFDNHQCAFAAKPERGMAGDVWAA
jgi:hypothetical protein